MILCLLQTWTVSFCVVKKPVFACPSNDFNFFKSVWTSQCKNYMYIHISISYITNAGFITWQCWVMLLETVKNYISHNKLLKHELNTVLALNISTWIKHSDGNSKLHPSKHLSQRWIEVSVSSWLCGRSESVKFLTGIQFFLICL